MESYLFGSSVDPNAKEKISELTTKLNKSNFINYLSLLDLPLKFKFTKLDELYVLADLLETYISNIENICKYFEKTAKDLDANTRLFIVWHNSNILVSNYLINFTWDTARFPLNRSLQQNAQTMYSAATSLEEEVRAISGKLNSMVQKFNTPTSLQYMPPYEIIASSNSRSNYNWIYTEHLTTIMCTILNQNVTKFLKQYKTFCSNVVPESHKFICSDANHSVYTIVVFKSDIDMFSTKAKVFGAIVKEFKYNEDKFNKYVEEKKDLKSEYHIMKTSLLRLSLASFSECFTTLCHLKIAQIFVENLLRYGADCKIVYFIVKLQSKIKLSIVVDMISSSIGVQSTLQQIVNKAVSDEDEDILPFVYNTIQPFSMLN